MEFAFTIKSTSQTTNLKRLPMARRDFGSKGNKIQLLTNHFRIGSTKNEGYLYHYNIILRYQDGQPVEGKRVGRKVMDKLRKTYDVLRSQNFAYDGEKNLFTLDSLHHTRQDFIVVLDEVSSIRVGNYPDTTKRMRFQSQSKTFKVEISHVRKISLQEIGNALRGHKSENYQDVLNVLGVILRQNATKEGCLCIRQSYFHDNPKNITNLDGGIQYCRGFHSSFRATQMGLSLNFDVSATLLIKPGPVVDFLLHNQNIQQPKWIDWSKAKRMLKNIRVKVNNREYKISGLSEMSCKTQMFLIKKGNDVNGEARLKEITIYEYYKRHKNIELHYSIDMPCINVGKPKKPIYFPMELCTLVSLQRYTKVLSNKQRIQLMLESRNNPHERKEALLYSLKSRRYDDEPMLRSFGISIKPCFTQVNGRVLQAPTLVVGKGHVFCPQNGSWNFNNKELIEPVKIKRWAIVNFSSHCDIEHLCNMIKKYSKMKGMFFDSPFHIFEESERHRSESPSSRVSAMYEIIKSKLPGPPTHPPAQLLLCILPIKKNCEIYGPWKRRCLVDEGIATQCIAPTKINDNYITNVLLKINTKLGGMNFLLLSEIERSIPLFSNIPTLVIGMDVSHGSPYQLNVPSVVAVVSSRYWPQISRYRATVRSQSSKVEIIQSLFEPVSDTKDDGIISEVLKDFYATSGRKPQQIIIFRDGVSESQFNQILNFELDEIIKACKHFDESWCPKFTLIVAQKNHHTRFFKVNAPQENVLPGTVIDNTICHPENNDFYMCAHAGKIGTSRPTHYYVLYDEIGFSSDNLQELVHSLCYVYQRSTNAISIVAPIYYAHVAAAQISQFLNFDETKNQKEFIVPGISQVLELPRLHERVMNTMFFC
ncbi:protein argonaute 4A-like [Vicia villosa]|uniref:protein argonaute 4A-like n=1 Tax=Vicia villosa TaxID=3911 RepID=UPI00273CD6B7|nr:protein argonaute 4A-like [Vicia villosa]